MAESFDKNSNSQASNSAGSLSSESLNWLKTYCLNIVRHEPERAGPDKPDLPLLVSDLVYEEDGDYSAQLNRVVAEQEAENLGDVVRKYRRTVLLGRGGGGKSSQLFELFVKQARTTLASLDQPSSTRARTATIPVLIDLSTGVKDNNFAALVNGALARYSDATPPANLLEEAAPLVLVDSLEDLNPAAAPAFIYSLNQWAKQAVPDTRLVVACHYLSFVYYNAWLKPDQQWRLYALQSLDWNQVRSALSPSFLPGELQKAEQVGLDKLLAHPALLSSLYPLLRQQSQPLDIRWLLNTFLEVVFENNPGYGLLLSQNSPLAKGGLSPEQAATPENIDRMLKLCVLEKHPVTGELRPLSEELEGLALAWVNRRLSPDISQALSRLLEAKDPSQQQNLVKLLYLLTGEGEQGQLFGSLLGDPPSRERLNLLLATGQIDGKFPESWQGYLNNVPVVPGDNSYGLRLLRMCSALGKASQDSTEQISQEELVTAGVALDRLISLGFADNTVYLELAQVQEQSGKREEALKHYRKISEELTAPSIEAMLGMIRMLIEANQHQEAEVHLKRLKQQLKDYEAESDYQMAVVRRSLKDFETALSYAKHAVNAGTSPRKLATYRFSLAQTYYDKGEKDKAEREFTRLAEDFPTYAEAFYELGRVQMERGDAEQALGNFRKAVELAPAKARYLYDLGRSLMAQQQYRQAYPYLQAASAQKDSVPEYLKAEGLVALKLNQVGDARAAFRQLVDSAGDKLTPEMPALLAAAEFAAGNYETAHQNIAKGLELSPNNPVLSLLGGLVAKAAGKFEPALTLFRKALLLKSQIKDGEDLAVIAHRELAQLLLNNGQQDDAEKHSLEAAKLRPNSAETAFTMGLLAMSRKDFKQAADYFGRGIDALSGNQPKGGDTPLPTGLQSEMGWLPFFTRSDNLRVELPYRQAVALRELGQSQDAQKVLQDVVATTPPSGPLPKGSPSLSAAIKYQYGMSLLDQSASDSQNFLAQSVEEDPDNAEYRVGLARSLSSSGDIRRALDELNRVKEINPDMPEANAEIAELQLANRTLDMPILLNSLNLYLKALATDGENPRYLFRAARLAYHLGYQNQCRELLTKALELDPAITDGHLLLACNLERGGDLTKALAEIGWALESPASSKSGTYLAAIRLARKAGALEEMERFIAGLPARNSLSLSMQATLRAEEGWLAMARQNYPEAADRYKQAIELRQKFALSQAGLTNLNLDELYYEDCTFEDLVQTGPGGEAEYQKILLANYRMAYAQALYKAGKAEQALNELGEVVSLNQKLAPAHSLRGELLSREGNHQEALASYQKALDLKPTPSRYYDLGRVYLALQNPPSAVSALERAASSREIAAKPDYYLHLGQAYQLAGNFTPARSAFTRGLQLDGDNIELHLALAESHLNAGDKLAAIQPLQEAIVRNPSNPDVRLELAQLYEDLTWWQEASKEYEQITALKPDSAASWYKHGQAQLRLGRVDQAREALEQALSLDNTMAEVHFELGQLYLKAYQSVRGEELPPPPEFKGMFGPLDDEEEVGDDEIEQNPEEALQEARDHLAQAVNLQGQVPAYLYTLALAEFYGGAYPAVEKACDQCLKLDPDNYEAHILLAEAYLRLNRPSAAWKVAQPAIKLYKHREDAWLLAARAAVHGKEWRRAVETLDLFLKVNHNQLVGALPFILLAQAYYDLGEPDKALAEMEQAQTRIKAHFTTPGPAFLALRARILRKLGKHDEAFELYREALQRDPQNPALHNELGETLLEQGKYEDSLKSFRQSLQVEPSNARYHYNAGIAAIRSAITPGQFAKRAEAFRQQGIDFLSKSTQLNPVMANYWYELAQAYEASRNYKLMRSALEQAIVQSPAFNDSEAPQVKYMRMYAQASIKLGDYDAARDTLNQILAVLPNDHETLAELGEIAHKLGTHGDSYNLFRKAELLAPDHPRYLASMARALMKLGRMDEAHELIQEAVHTNKDDHFVRHQLGVALVENGRHGDAISHLAAAAEKEPGNAEFRYYLGKAYRAEGRLAEAIHEYQEALAMAPLQHRWHAELGELYLREKAYLPALESMRMAVQLEPSRADYRYNLAIALAANGEAQQAIYQVREVLSKFGDRAGAEWHYLLGRLLAELGRYEEAQKSFARAYEIEPTNPDYKVDLAKTMRLKGEPIEEIKILLEEVVAANPDELRSLEELATIYETEKELEKALQTLEPKIQEILRSVRSLESE